MRTVSWTKLGTAELQGSMWGDADSASLGTPLGDMEKVLMSSFTIQDDDKKVKQPAAKPEKKRVLEGNRQQAVGIVMSVLKLGIERTVEAIATVDDDLIDADGVARLEAVFPTAEEEQVICAIKEEDLHEYNAAEVFCWKLLHVPRPRIRMRCLQFRDGYSSAVDEIRSGVRALDTACARLKQHRGLRKVLMTVLAMGNILNQGSFAGAASGIRVTNLAETLQGVKSVDGKTTLFQLFAEHVLDVSPEVCCFTAELSPAVEAAAQNSSDNLVHILRDLLSGVRTVSNELDRSAQALVGAPADVDAAPLNIRAADAFRSSFGGFFEKAKVEVEGLEAALKRCKEDTLELARWFGEKQGEFEEAVFFGNLLAFFRAFDKEVAGIRAARERSQRRAGAPQKTDRSRAAGAVIAVAACAAVRARASRAIHKRSPMPSNVTRRLAIDDDPSDSSSSAAPAPPFSALRAKHVTPAQAVPLPQHVTPPKDTRGVSMSPQPCSPADLASGSSRRGSAEPTRDRRRSGGSRRGPVVDGDEVPITVYPAAQVRGQPRRDTPRDVDLSQPSSVSTGVKLVAERSQPRQMEPAVQSVVWSATGTALMYTDDEERQRARRKQQLKEAEALRMEVQRLQRQREDAGDDLTSESSLDSFEKAEEVRLEQRERRAIAARCSDWLQHTV